MAVDWLKIKTEYINDTSTSYRKLSAKYGVSTNSICKKAKEERWSDQRQQQLNNTCTEVVQKTVEKISETLSEEAASKVRIRAKLLKMAENWVNAQEEQIHYPADFRRIVQSCVDLGVMDVQESEDYDDDGLLEALGNNAEQLFDDGDDSDLLPEDEEGDEDV